MRHRTDDLQAEPISKAFLTYGLPLTMNNLLTAEALNWISG